MRPSLDCNIGEPSQRQEFGQICKTRGIAVAALPAQMVDQELEPGMPFRHSGDFAQKTRRQQRDRQPRALGGGPQPGHGAVRPPGLLVRLEQRKAQPEHTRPLLPRLNQTLTLRSIEREVAEDRQPLRVLLSSLDRDLIASGIPRRRMQHRGIHTGFVHLAQQAVFREYGDLPMSWHGRWPVAPDVDLSVNNAHCAS